MDIRAGHGKQMIEFSKICFDECGLEQSKQFHELAITKTGLNTHKLKLTLADLKEYP